MVYDPNSRFITNPNHGGKVTCEGCGCFVEEDSKYMYLKHSDRYICEECWQLQMNGLFK